MPPSNVPPAGLAARSATSSSQKRTHNGWPCVRWVTTISQSEMHDSRRRTPWRSSHVAGVLNRFLLRSKTRPTSTDDRRGMRELRVVPISQSVEDEPRAAFVGGSTMPVGALWAVAEPTPMRPTVDEPTAPVVDIVVPVYNEERALEPSVRRLHGYLTPDSRSRGASRSSTTRPPTRLGRRPIASPASSPACTRVHLDRKGRGFALRSRVGRERRRGRRLHGRRPLDRSRRAAPARRAPRVGSLRRRDRLAPRTRVARRPPPEARAHLPHLQPHPAHRARDPRARRAVRVQGGARRCRAAPRCPRSRTTAGSSTPSSCCSPSTTDCASTRSPVDWVDDTDSRVHVVSTALGDLKGTGAHGATASRRDAAASTSDPAARAPLANDFGRRFVSFSLIGVASTAVSLVLFLATRDAIGPIAANVVAVTATFVANAWANARYTERRARPRWAAAFGLLRGLDRRDERRARAGRRGHDEPRRAARGARRHLVGRRRRALRRDRESVTMRRSVHADGRSRQVVRRRSDAATPVPRSLPRHVALPRRLGRHDPAQRRGPRGPGAGCGRAGRVGQRRRGLLRHRALVLRATGTGCGVARGRSDFAREVVPFWVLSLAGLVASTVAVSSARPSSAAHWSTSARAIALPARQPLGVRRALAPAVRAARQGPVQDVVPKENVA